MNVEIRSLEGVPLSQVAHCIGESFVDYFVPIPSEVEFWRSRFKVSGVRMDLSYGCFHEHRLIGFILHSVGNFGNEHLVFNTGTGVIPEFRGRSLVDKMYERAIPELKQKGIRKCGLEVIVDNHRAIRVYERIGFIRDRKLITYSGEITHQPSTFRSVETDFGQFHFHHSEWEYSWDNTIYAIQRVPDLFRFYQIRNGKDEVVGGYILKNDSPRIPQLHAREIDSGIVLNEIARFHSSIQIMNIDERRSGLIRMLDKNGFHHQISQYEMYMSL